MHASGRTLYYAQSHSLTMIALFDTTKHKYKQVAVYSPQCILRTVSSVWVRHTHSPKPSSEQADVFSTINVSVLGCDRQGSFVTVFQGLS